MKIETVKMVSVSELFAGHPAACEYFWECADCYTWGDTRHTLITRGDAMDVLDPDELPDEVVERFNELPADVFIDLEGQTLEPETASIETAA